MAFYWAACLFGTRVAETILASVHVRAHQQVGHMDASDLIKTLQNTLRGGGRPHMGLDRGPHLGQRSWRRVNRPDTLSQSTRPSDFSSFLLHPRGRPHMHQSAGHPLDTKHPAIRETLRGIARKHGAPARRSAALTTAEVKRLSRACGTDLAGARDRALFLVGFAGALRRSELVALGVARRPAPAHGGRPEDR